MSEALERVIAEQQREIDRLRDSERMNAEQWQQEHKRHEALVEAAFGYMNNPDTPYSKMMLMEALIAYGYCPTCEASPCECEGQYD